MLRWYPSLGGVITPGAQGIGATLRCIHTVKSGLLAANQASVVSAIVGPCLWRCTLHAFRTSGHVALALHLARFLHNRLALISLELSFVV